MDRSKSFLEEMNFKNKNEPSEHVGTDSFTQRNSKCKGPDADDIGLDQCDQSPVSKREGCLKWRLSVGQGPSRREIQDLKSCLNLLKRLFHKLLAGRIMAQGLPWLNIQQLRMCYVT